MIDLEIAISDYYASKNSEIDPEITIKPSVEALPETGNGEGDVRRRTSDHTYHLFDSGKWNQLDTGDGADIEFATDEELEEMLRQGEEEARG